MPVCPGTERHAGVIHTAGHNLHRTRQPQLARRRFGQRRGEPLQEARAGQGSDGDENDGCQDDDAREHGFPG